MIFLSTLRSTIFSVHSLNPKPSLLTSCKDYYKSHSRCIFYSSNMEVGATLEAQHATSYLYTLLLLGMFFSSLLSRLFPAVVAHPQVSLTPSGSFCPDATSSGSWLQCLALTATLLPLPLARMHAPGTAAGMWSHSIRTTICWQMSPASLQPPRGQGPCCFHLSN